MDGISGFSSQIRFTGLSGFDTETVVQELMKAERIPLDTLKQKRTLVEWKQEAYREISSLLIGFKSKFFDIVNRSTYLLSQNSITPMSAVSTNNTYVTAAADGTAAPGNYSIKVLQIAEAAKAVSSEGISGDISGIVKNKELSGKSILVTLDGVTKKISLENYTDSDLAWKLQASLDNAFGASKIKVEFDAENQVLSINTANGATKVSVYEPSDQTGALSDLGLLAGDSNRISLKDSLLSLQGSLGQSFTFSEQGTVTFSINGVEITANSDETLEQVFQKINNNSEINATIKYDEITDKITLVSKQTGAGDHLSINDTENGFLQALKLTSVIQGQDARVSINGEDPIVRSTNTFKVNGITYTLNKAHEDYSMSETITVSQDVDSVIQNIKGFVEEYNKLIDTINGKLRERYDRNYLPLTELQRKEMEEKDIEKWEEKAKTGLLQNDSILQDIVYSMRRALYEKVEGVDLILSDIGISSKSYTDYGKLYLDEDKLRNALLNNPNEVSELLIGVSEENPVYARDLTSWQKKDRYSKSGVLQRLSDIINDNVSTIRDQNGRKGILLEKAGIEGDLSNTGNLLNAELERYDKRINDLLQKLIRKEESYYREFSRLETMLNRMNQQSAWLIYQFGMN
jgi:flagellar hook-associated protein 2